VTGTTTGHPSDTHEPLHRDEPAVGPSDRSFGLLFTAVFTLVALAPAWRHRPLRAWALEIAAFFLACALVMPAVLSPLNQLWLRLGLVMHRIVNPVVMGTLFYLVVTPFGLVLRMLGKGRAAGMHPDPSAATYWIDRRQQPHSRMDQQF
jgi:hypothetical protein